MLHLSDVVQVLASYQGRYEFLDAFVDDVQELSSPFPLPGALVDASGPRPILQIQANGTWLRVEIFSDQGIARFRLLGIAPNPLHGEAVNAGAALGGILGGALGAATSKKEGLLGGLVLGMLVGGFIGAATAPVERALAIQFDPGSASWKLYDGPLLNWAKRALLPAASQ
jgi:hypothetical protein